MTPRLDGAGRPVGWMDVVMPSVRHSLTHSPTFVPAYLLGGPGTSGLNNNFAKSKRSFKPLSDLEAFPKSVFRRNPDKKRRRGNAYLRGKLDTSYNKTGSYVFTLAVVLNTPILHPSSFPI